MRAWCVVFLLAGCGLEGGDNATPPRAFQEGCLAELGVAAPTIDEAPGDFTDAQKAMEAQVECERVVGTSPSCDASRVLSREAALCAAIEAGAELERVPWRIGVVFIERFERLVWSVQVPHNDSRDNFKLDAFSGDLLDITVSSATP